jgi:hypothetical protein
MDNSGGAPQAAPLLNLRFGQGTPGPDTVVAQRVATPPVLDGQGADWQGVPASTVPLMPRGAPVGLGAQDWEREYSLAYGRVPPFDFGIREVTVRAAYDERNLYFLLEWADPTEDRRREEWSFDGSAWTRSRASEDCAVLAFSVGESFRGFAQVGCAAACHMKTRLGEVTDEAKAYRFRMHTSAPQELGDVWLWRAATTNPVGYADDQHWDHESRKPDGPLEWAVANVAAGTGGGAAQPAFMSASGVNANPEALYAAGVPGTQAAVPFAPDGALPGARLPGWVLQQASAPRADVRAVGRWSGGRWAVELSRARTNDDPKDAQFPLK